MAEVGAGSVLLRAGSGECDPFGRKAQVNNAVLAGRRPNLTTLPAGLPPALLALLASCWAAAPAPPNASPRMLSHHSDPFPPYGGLMVHLKILF